VAERALRRRVARASAGGGAVAAGRKAFYNDAAAASPGRVIDLPDAGARGGAPQEEPGASLVDLGDGVASWSSTPR
jgi:hypothetical protein